MHLKVEVVRKTKKKEKGQPGIELTNLETRVHNVTHQTTKRIASWSVFPFTYSFSHFYGARVALLRDAYFLPVYII